MIPIGGPKYTQPRAVPVLPVPIDKFWDNYYTTHDEKDGEKGIEDLREKVGLLNASKKFPDVHAILYGFLRHHSNRAEPWMYEALALSIKMNRGPDKDVRQSLGYAADLAIKSHNPNHLVSVADVMFLQGYYERVGALLDQAADLVPQRGEPLVMSINLARRTKDPKRMARSIDKLLSLGWPNMDDTVRSDARKQAELLAETLRAEGRIAEAETLLEGLPEAEARDLFIRLKWVGDAGLDLAVEEPLGATACAATPRTVFGGSIVKDGYGKHPEEVYVCPRAFNGVYTIRVVTNYNNEKKPALQATLEIVTHEGTAREHKEIKVINLGKPIEPITVTLTGGRRMRALPYVSPTPSITLPKAPAGTAAKAKKAAPVRPVADKR